MKFNKFLIGTLFIGGLMTSCKDDMGPENPGQILENETTTFVRVSLVDNTGTRAGAAPGHELGTKDESAIKEILLTFFDAGRNYVGKSLVSVNEDSTQITVPGENNTIERIKTVIAQVDLPQKINYPKYVVAYVNPTTQSGDLATEKLEDAMKFLREKNSVSSNGYRTMNNSVYFDENTGYTRFATEVDFKTNFFESADEAKKAENATIDIYVERMEAKIRLSSPLNDITSNSITSNSAVGEDAYTLQFVPEYWFVNGTEKRSFLLKNYRSERLNHTTNMTITDFGHSLSSLQNGFVNGGWATAPAFNSFANKRSYWAIDPTYFFDQEGDFYPDISYDVLYGSVNSDLPNAKSYPLTYRSYTSVKNEYAAGSTNYVKFNGPIKTHEYVLENTMSYNTLRSLDAKAAMTSVVLLGHYVIKKGTEVVFNGNENDTNKSFYVRHEASFGSDGNEASKNMIMLNDTEAINFFIERSGSTFFVQKRDKDGNVIDGEFEPLRASHLSTETSNGVNYGISHSDFELVYPGTDITNGKKQSEQWRTIAVKKNANGKFNDNIYIFDYTMNEGAGGYKKLNELTEAGMADELDAFLDRMYSSFGVIEKFQAGKAYFNVPLRHIWADLSSSSNEFKADQVKLGEYGVVRNHVYDLTINSIKGLGTGIGDINQPIVPPTENEQYFISTRLNILQWRLVKQSVDL